MKETLDTNYFETNDFALAVSLICTGFHIAELNRVNQNRVSFLFERSKQLETSVRAFWNNELRVEPKGFFNTQKELKARIYSSV